MEVHLNFFHNEVDGTDGRRFAHNREAAGVPRMILVYIINLFLFSMTVHKKLSNLTNFTTPIQRVSPYCVA